MALHCPGGYIRRVPRALGQTASKLPIMEGGEGPALPSTSQTTSLKDQSAVGNGRGKSPSCQKVSASFSFLRRFPSLGRLAWHGCPPQPTPFPPNVPSHTCPFSSTDLLSSAVLVGPKDFQEVPSVPPPSTTP